MRIRHFYLGLCVLGLAVPNAAFWPWLAAHGFAPRQFISDLFSNGISTFFGLDVLLTALVLLVFVVSEGRRLGMRHRWISVAAACLVGVSLALPLFLYQRQLRLDRMLEPST